MTCINNEILYREELFSVREGSLNSQDLNTKTFLYGLNCKDMKYLLDICNFKLFNVGY